VPAAKRKKYGLFTPAAIAEAMEIAQTLPAPLDQATIKKLGYTVRPGWCRAIIDLPIGVAWRAEKLRRARGITRGRVYQEIVTYYLVHAPEAALDGIPAAYAEFASPEGLEVLTRALTESLRRALAGGTSIGEMAAADETPMARNNAYPGGNGTRTWVPAVPLPDIEPLSEAEIAHEVAEFDEFDLSKLK
jgi:hypothetical protein